MYRVSTDGAIAQTEQISKERSSLVEGYKGEVEAYRATVQAQADWYRALTDADKAKLEKSRLEIERAAEIVKAYLQSTVSVNGLRADIIKAMSNVSAQVLAAALNAINTTIGHTTSYGEDRSERISRSESVDENHNYPHAES